MQLALRLITRGDTANLITRAPICFHIARDDSVVAIIAAADGLLCYQGQRDSAGQAGLWVRAVDVLGVDSTKAMPSDGDSKRCP